MRNSVTSGSPFEQRIGFSRAVRVGPFVAVSGTAPIAPDGSVASPGDMYGQTRCCLQIIEQAATASTRRQQEGGAGGAPPCAIAHAKRRAWLAPEP